MYCKFILIYRALDFNSLVGNVGGYVGLFIGVSILQAPALLLKLFRFISESYKTSGRRRFNIIPNETFVNRKDEPMPLHSSG